jgi:hypothetical protein
MVTNADENEWVAETIYAVMIGAEIPPICPHRLTLPPIVDIPDEAFREDCETDRLTR